VQNKDYKELVITNVQELLNKGIQPIHLLTDRLVAVNSFLSLCLVPTFNEKLFYEFLNEQLYQSLNAKNNIYDINDENLFSNYPIRFYTTQSKNLSNILLEHENTDRDSLRQVVDILVNTKEISEARNDILDFCIEEYKYKLNIYEKDKISLNEKQIINIVQNINHIYNNNQEFKESNDNKFLGFLNRRNLKVKTSNLFKVGYTKRYSIENYIFDPVHVFISIVIINKLYEEKTVLKYIIKSKDSTILDLMNGKNNISIENKEFQENMDSIIKIIFDCLKKQFEEIEKSSKIFKNAEFNQEFNEKLILNDNKLTENFETEEMVYPKLNLEYNYFFLYMDGRDFVCLYHKITCKDENNCYFFNKNCNKDIYHNCLFLKIHANVCDQKENCRARCTFLNENKE
jgi:hypothetical protein